MHFSQLLIASSAFAASVLATNHTTAPVSGQGQVAVHVVQVGSANRSITFSPNNIKANVGDMVQFQFWGNHSVAQAAFDQPCVPLAQSGSANGTQGFFSGFVPTNRTLATGMNGVMVFTVPVTNARPIWFYCTQGRHCQNGMVGAINAPATGERTLEAFTSKAASATQNITPGIGPSTGGSGSPSNGGGSGTGSGSGGSGGSSGGSGSELTPSTTSTLPPQQTANKATSLQVGPAMVALAAAAVAFLTL